MTSHASEVDRSRELVAPYNFIPLPELPFTPDGAPPRATCFLDFEGGAATHSGWIDYEIVSLSPLYTRTAVPPDTDANADARREFFYYDSPSNPVIPGSTTRGFVRNVMTILAAGKLPRSKDRRFFYRSFSGDVLSDSYSQRMISKERARGSHGTLMGFRCKTEAGFLSKDGERWSLRPCYQLRVSHNRLRDLGLRDFHIDLRRGEPGERGGVANPASQYRRVWVRAQNLEPEWRHHPARGQSGMYTWRRDVDAISLQEQTGTEWHEGWLVISGPMAKKAAEFVFVEKAGARPQPVDADVIKDLNDVDDQITPYQTDAFPPNGVAEPGRRLTDLREREDFPPALPVWYLEERDERSGATRITAVGRAQNFRLAYRGRSSERVPEGLRADANPSLDLVERVFGRVRQPKRGEEAKGDDQLRGRVRFEDAHIVGTPRFYGGATAAEGRRRDKVPNVLSSPKASAFQAYLTQREGALDKKSLQHFDSANAQIRGFKQYWHRNTVGADGRRRSLPEPELFQSKTIPGRLDTVIRPLDSGNRFRGRVRFDNLTELELGALLAALDLSAAGEGHAGKLGMGKPLGMGSVAVENVSLTVIDRRARYGSWSETGEREGGDVGTAAREVFRSAMVTHHNTQKGVPIIPEDTPLWSIPRNRLLEMMLRWDGAPPAERTRYVNISEGDRDNPWRQRSVLPGPHQLVGERDPMRYNPIRTVDARPDRPFAEGTYRLEVLGPPKKGEAPCVEPGSKRKVTLRQIPPSAVASITAGKWVEARVTEAAGDLFGAYLGTVAAPRAERIPADALTVTITGGGPGSFKGVLTGDRDMKVWPIKGRPSDGSRPRVGDTVPVRIEGAFLVLL